MVQLLDIGPTDKWIPGFFSVPPARLQSSWRVDVIKSVRYLRKSAKAEAVETPQSWWTAHLEAGIAFSDEYNDKHGLPRRKVPPGLREAFVDGNNKGGLEGNNVNEQGRANSRSVLVRRSCRVAPTPSAVSKAKHSKPLREAIDACCASLLKASLRKKAWQVKQRAAVAAFQNDDPAFWEVLAELRMDVAAYWVLREDARRRQEVARVAALSKARAAATTGGGEGGSGGPAGALEASEAVELLNEYKCPITAEIMTDPVCTADGFTYERTAITEWLRSNDTSPSTGAKLTCKRLIPNITVRCLLQRL